MNTAKYPQVGSVWRHYKGGIYIVCDHIYDKADSQIKVAYRNISNPLVYIRSLDKWYELVKSEDDPTLTVPRYVQIEANHDPLQFELYK